MEVGPAGARTKERDFQGAGTTGGGSVWREQESTEKKEL